jgi:ATP-dependent helicase/DNAse subunit B
LIEQVAQQLDGNRRWSASQLNEYAVCPYRFFAKRLLKVEALKEPDEGMDALQYGSMVHEMLELTYRQIGEEGLSITLANRDRAVEILDAVMTDILRRAPARYGFRATRLWAHEQMEFRRRLTELINVDFSEKSPLSKLSKGTRYTRHHEVSFGGEREDGTTTEVVIDGEAGPIHIYGVIDRVDEVGDHLIVVDYKTGSTPIPHTEMTSGRNVQMLVYLRAAQQLFPDKHVLGGAFWHLRKRTLSGQTNANDDGGVIDQAVANLHQRVIAGRHGDFVNAPSKMDGHKCSSHCEFYQLCRMNQASTRKA